MEIFCNMFLLTIIYICLTMEYKEEGNNTKVNKDKTYNVYWRTYTSQVYVFTLLLMVTQTKGRILKVQPNTRIKS